MNSICFVCYGSGHVKMVVPVARALQARGGMCVQVLALTTAADVVRQMGLPLLQFKDFIDSSNPADVSALTVGRRLMADLSGPVADEDETAAYLGLSFADLVNEHGAQEAARRYALLGRQAFLPVATLERILRRVKPDLLVTTNSPRAEQAAILAAGRLGVPALCMVDLFAIDEVQWIGHVDYAQTVCVLNASVKDFLVTAGRRPEQIIVTGNPAFDALHADGLAQQGQALRSAQGWQSKKVIVWPTQIEPAVHTFNGQVGDPTLPARALQQLMDFVLAHDDCVLCVRPRSGEAVPVLPDHPRIIETGQTWPLAPLLHAADMVVTLSSTVGLEGHLVGARVVQILGSVYDHAMPMLRYGVADESVQISELTPAVARCLALPRRLSGAQSRATPKVVDAICAIFD